MSKVKKMWVFSPPKQARPKVPDAVKAHVSVKANGLIDTVLKPAHIKPPAGDERFNYIVELYSRWYRNYFYFCSRYACPGPHAISPYFEAKFARLEYAGYDRFHLSCTLHTSHQDLGGRKNHEISLNCLILAARRDLSPLSFFDTHPCSGRC